MKIHYDDTARPDEVKFINGYKYDIFYNEGSLPYTVLWFKENRIVDNDFLNKYKIGRYENDLEVNKYKDRLIIFGTSMIIGNNDSLDKIFNDKKYLKYLSYDHSYIISSLRIITNKFNSSII